MRINKLFPVGILVMLTIITIGAVSAADDLASDNLTVELDQQDSIDLSNVESEISSDEEDDFVGEDEYEDDDYYYVYMPSEVYKTDDYVMDFELYDGAEGDVTITIDDAVIYQNHVEEGYYEVYSDEIMTYDYGTYDLVFSYDSSDGIHDSFTKSKQIEITYRFSAYFYYESEEYTYDNEDILVNLRTPVSEGTITYTINGKSYSVNYDDLEYDDDMGNGVYVKSDDLKIGENKFVFTYVHPNYPQKSDEIDLTILPRIELYDYNMNWDETNYASLILPKTAKGNLEVYIDDELYKSTPLTNGFANITIKDLSLGSHDFQAKYTGSDFDVESIFDEIEVTPKITIPRKVYRYGDYSLQFELPSNFAGELTLTIDEQSKSVNVVNGKATINLFNLESAEAEEYEEWVHVNAYLDYVGNNGYNYDTFQGITVSDDNPDMEINLNSNKEVIRNYDGYHEFSSFHGSFYVPEEAFGSYEVYIDGKLFDEGYCDYDTEFDINVDNLTLGKHNVELKYSGNSYYLPKTVITSFELVDMIIKIPENVEIMGEGSHDVDVYFNKHILGNITILADGEVVKQATITPAYYGDSIWFDLSYLDLTTHKIEVKYSGDSQHKAVSKSSNVKVNYTISVYGNEFVYGGADNFINIAVPEDATSQISAKIDGKSVNVRKDEYNYLIDVSDVAIGEHSIDVTYSGDQRYPKLTVSKSFLVYPEIIISYGGYNSGENYVYLKLPGDAKGNLIVFVYESQFANVKLNNGVANVSLDSLKLGEFEIYAEYDGSDYDVESRNSDVTISPNIDVKQYYTVNESGYISVELPSDANGNLIVEIDGNQYAKEKFINGKVNVTVDGLKLGSHDVSLFYDGHDYDLDEDLHFEIDPLNFNFWPVNAGDVIFMQLPGDANGNLIVKFDGKQIGKDKFKNGYASVNVPNLANGWHDITVSYDGDDYGPFTYEEAVLIKPKASIFDGISKTKVELHPIAGATYHLTKNVSTTDKVVVELPDKFNGEFTATLDDAFLTKGKFVDGVATFDLTNAKLGLQHLYIDYEYAKDKHDFISFYVTLKKSPNLSVDVKDITEGEIANINFAADSSLNGNVLVSINNANYTVSLVNGKGSLDVPNLGNGFYEIQTFFNDTVNFGHQGVISTFIVNNKTYPPVIKASDLSMQYLDGSKFTVTVYGTDGNVAVNTPVVIKISGKKVAGLNTDGNGKVSYKVTSIPKTYKISVTALGITVTKKLTVKQILTVKTVKVKKSAKSLVLTATLKKVKGKYLKNKKITFKFNGKTYNAKTNKKGVAKVTIKKAVLNKLKVGKKVTYQATYLKDTVKKTVKVLK